MFESILALAALVGLIAIAVFLSLMYIKFLFWLFDKFM